MRIAQDITTASGCEWARVCLCAVAWLRSLFCDSAIGFSVEKAKHKMNQSCLRTSFLQLRFIVYYLPTLGICDDYQLRGYQQEYWSFGKHFFSRFYLQFEWIAIDETRFVIFLFRYSAQCVCSHLFVAKQHKSGRSLLFLSILLTAHQSMATTRKGRKFELNNHTALWPRLKLSILFFFKNSIRSTIKMV